jgi:hypothetical protein
MNKKYRECEMDLYVHQNNNKKKLFFRNVHRNEFSRPAATNGSLKIVTFVSKNKNNNFFEILISFKKFKIYSNWLKMR